MSPPSIPSGDLVIRHCLGAKSSLLSVAVVVPSPSLLNRGSRVRGGAGRTTASPTRSRAWTNLEVSSRLERRGPGRRRLSPRHLGTLRRAPGVIVFWEVDSDRFGQDCIVLTAQLALRQGISSKVAGRTLAAPQAYVACLSTATLRARTDGLPEPRRLPSRPPGVASPLRRAPDRPARQAPPRRRRWLLRDRRVTQGPHGASCRYNKCGESWSRF